MQEFLKISDPKLERKMVPYDFSITEWKTLEPYYQQLLEEKPNSVTELEMFLRKVNEIDAIVAEDLAWRYIRMTCNTQKDEYKKDYQYFIQEILPPVSVIKNTINRKIADNPWFDAIDPMTYQTFTRSLKREIALFREENVALESKAASISQQHTEIMGSMTIHYDGKEITVPEAGIYLEKPDRKVRQEVWDLLRERRAMERDKILGIFDQLVELRHNIAQNAGYESYTSYKFDQLARFDYTLEDTRSFHEAVEKVVKPIYGELMQERKERMGLSELRPWDLTVDIFADTPLAPFSNSEELIQKSIETLSRLRPELGKMISIMNEHQYLDLDTRPGKAPGGYNYPLMETGIPFIFMNAANSHKYVITMLHESGHAIHSFLTRNIPLDVLKQTPSEVAELASMTMELLCLDKYDIFYPDSEAVAVAQKSQLYRCIDVFPWIATVDAFQQWVYDHPKEDADTRNRKFEELYIRFHGDFVNWDGYEEVRQHLWLKQSHIFDVPFYYIEYAIAQLGALAIWRNYKLNPEEGLNQYLDALKLGYSKPIPEIYQTAGIAFDFSEDYMRTCMDFCLEEYKQIPTGKIIPL
ncbi:MAG: M3 family oligoendopeptidase [Bacteroidia bacterium]|nr:M3 family oligoendopeptidase [Bacteroidia bacterium]